MTNEGQAIIIFIDNSETSINGDFYPNRLDAQKTAAERLIQFFTRVNPQTQIAIGTLAEDSFGIMASLTMNSMKLEESISKIKRGKLTHLVHGIRCGFLALHHCDPEVNTKRIIVFVGSEHDMTDTKISTQLAQHANKEDVSVDVVAFGDEVNCKDILEDFTSKIHEKSYFVSAKSNSAILSDIVLSSPIGPGDISYQDNVNFEDDPDLALTIQLSMQQQDDHDDPEIQALLLQSQKYDGDSADVDETELALAIQLSKQDAENQKNDNNKNNEHSTNDNEQVLEDLDPDLAMAIMSSKQDIENQKVNKKDDKQDDKKDDK